LQSRAAVPALSHADYYPAGRRAFADADSGVAATVSLAREPLLPNPRLRLTIDLTRGPARRQPDVMGTSEVEHLFERVMKLAREDRVALLDRLIEEAGDDGQPAAGDWDAGWLPELMARREARLEHGDGYLVDADEAIARIRRSLPPHDVP
jgi:hypothetical protein